MHGCYCGVHSELHLMICIVLEGNFSSTFIPELRPRPRQGVYQRMDALRRYT